MQAGTLKTRLISMRHVALVFLCLVTCITTCGGTEHVRTVSCNVLLTRVERLLEGDDGSTVFLIPMLTLSGAFDCGSRESFSVKLPSARNATQADRSFLDLLVASSKVGLKRGKRTLFAIVIIQETDKGIILCGRHNKEVGLLGRPAMLLETIDELILLDVLGRLQPGRD